jgi:8-oxo-dGTP pyrophosphatase MutT (NUDIX family)
MAVVKSCGVLVFRRAPQLAFLLMKHRDRWDVPKGHVDPGESDIECALRELHEETGISSRDIQLDPQFRYSAQYPVVDKRFPGETATKTLFIFLGWLERDVPIQISEHVGYQWFAWHPPHQIQPQTINPLLAEVERYFATAG